ncbi:MAG: Ig-like domain repeat protein, partial [Gammaproteobacteria bacterium]|nr:Ig-like domain repeat protein [Gammaproteobacteria bacterium]
MTYLILKTLANGRTQHIEVTENTNLTAQQGANYTLIDAETQQPPKNLKIVKKGNALIIEENGKELANINDFFAENSTATFTTDGSTLVSNAAPANIISNQSALAAAIGDEAVIWSADASASEGLFGFDPSTLAMAGGALLTGGLSSVNLFNQSADNAPLLTPRALTPTLTLTVGADIATATEASAGAVSLVTAVGETISVVFSNGANNVTVNLVGDGTTQTVALTAIDLTTLGDGTITVDATSTDAANLTATASASFVLDTVASVAPNISVTAADATAAEAQAGAVTVNPAAGDITNVIFSNGGNSVTVAIAGDGTAQSVALSSVDLTTLGDGTISVDATTTDAAGNVSAPATQTSFILDTIAPATPALTISAANTDATEAEALAGVVSVNPALGETTQVTFTNGTVQINKTVIGTGLSQAVSLSSAEQATLGNGTIDVNSVTIDTAGNIKISSTSSSFVLDSLIPTAPSIVLNSDSGTAGDSISNDGSLIVSGDEVGALIEYSSDAGVTWAATFTAAEGVNSVMVRQTDVAGNISPASAALNFTLDTTVATPNIALSNDSGIAADLISNDGTLNVTGTEAGALIEYSSDAGNTWATIFSAVEGSNSVMVRQTDSAGNVSIPSAELTFTLDTQATAPSVALSIDSGLAGDNLSNDGALALTGVEVGATVEYSTNGIIWTPTFTAVEGLNNLVVRQTDAAGNVSAPSAVLTFTLDSQIPAAPAISLTNDSGTVGDGISNDGSITVSGAEIGAVVEYSSDAGNTWTTTFTAIDGINSVVVRQTDAAGNVSPVSAPLDFTLDNLAPLAPSLALNVDSGTVGDALTNDGTLNVTGTEAGSTVEYSTNGITWSATFIAIEGLNNVVARQVDAAGNVSPNSAVLTFTLDSQIPSAPSVSLTNDSGTVGDGISNDGTLNVTGTEAGALIEYSADGGGLWTPTFTAIEGNNSVQVRQTDAAGNVGLASAPLAFTLNTVPLAAPSLILDVDSGALADGITNVGTITATGTDPAASVEYSTNGITWSPIFIAAEGLNNVVARQVDPAGNVSSNSAVLTFTLDTAAPIAPNVALSVDSGAIGDGITNDGTLNVTGTEAGALIEYSIDGINWTPTFTAIEGNNSVQVRQTDAAGNVSLASAPLVFTLNTAALAAPTLDLAVDSGAIGDLITNDGALNVLADPTATVEYSIDGGNTWTAAFTAVEGLNSVQVRQTDTSGNVSLASAPLTFTLDTAAPIAPSVALSVDSGAIGDGISNDGTLNVTGTEAGALIEYSADGVNWTPTFT